MWIGRRDQRPAAASAGIDESFVEVEQVWANILPVGTMTFWGGVQVDSPVTHRIWTRWIDYLDNRHAVLRDVTLPGGGTRREIFRVRRVVEDQGRKRFTMIEAELEQTA